MKGGAHRLQFKEGIKPVHCKKPNWGINQKRYLLAWAEELYQWGILESAKLSKWASRPHLAPKLHPTGAEELMKIRACGAYGMVNDLLEKLPPNNPSIHDFLLQAGDGVLFWQFDCSSAYYQIELDERDRDATTIWTPLGLSRFTRLPFGVKNAAAILQARINAALATLSADVRSHISNFADDITGSQQTVDYDLGYKITKSIFEMCKSFSITLGRAKTRLGYDNADILGYHCGRGHLTVEEANLLPIRRLKPPSNLAELRRVIGLFDGSKAFINDYATRMAPLYDLRKAKNWCWTTVHQRSFEEMKETILKRPHISVPDNSKNLHLDTDASDVAAGAVLYQYVNDERESPPDTSERKIIRYMSTRFDQAMRDRPIFYKEAYAVIWSLAKCEPLYLRHNPFTAIVHTDHNPLRWMKLSTKGPVSRWLLENIADVDFKILYKPCPLNVLADALSRPPCIEVGSLAPTGIATTLESVLRTLPSGLSSKAKV